ncbi:HAMP domain-containing histidine kinase [Luteolibacter ambystomatis]|uniref:histidine kinase n=1 Tax=Luteolibacter ambystomatis TaxID=2824561 RepID=A0A975IZ06_9BACT|nr:HAMP domain-containing sensor histidine kinase [Luteolibacter ambystomatis]QUE50971.1 HAMP domain-containing histidine kinase [Luteolibacter ambystomatis]
MKSSWRHSLLAKMLGWLALHLLVLALIFGGLLALQLRLGLDSLLAGRTGDHLKDLGEVVGAELRATPRTEWPTVLSRHSASRGLQLDVWQPPERWEAGAFKGVPRNVMDRIREARLPQSQRSQNPPPLQGRPPGDRPPPPPPRAGGDDLFDGGLLGDGPPENRRQGPPPGRRNEQDEDFQPPRGRPLPASAPVFLVRGESGNGYWAGIEFPLRPAPGTGGPQHALLIVRSEDLSGNGLFFEIRPWIFGGFAVLAVSVAFWAPFALSITRYVGRLTRATERIAEGDFQVTVETSRRDELGRLGVAVTEMAGRLDRFVSGQRRFLADVAHELCAPLARVRTGIAVLEQTVPEDNQARLLSVDDDAGELARLIDEILAFSRAGAGRPQLRTTELEPLIRDVAAREGEELEIAFILEPDLTAHVDLRLLSRAFGNLVRNVRVHAGAGAKLEIMARRLGAQLSVTFRDNGPGVPAEDLPRLFEPFYRPDRSRTRDTGGSGLGLAIVRTCIEACGGRVSASNPSEGGFEVAVSLPVE